MSEAGPRAEELEPVARALAAARRVLVITGAGISAESGLPTYRGIGGLYEDRDPEEGIPIEEALSGDMLATRPLLCWKYLDQIGKAVARAGPNRAHEVLAEMQDGYERFLVFTQNVDGYHREAGSRDVIDIHGDCHDLVCLSCDAERRLESYEELRTLPPGCPRCHMPERPKVVLFGEVLPFEKLTRLQEALARGFDVTLAIGTTAVFPYVAAPVLVAAAAGRTTVEINPGESEVSHAVAHRLPHPAGITLERLWERVRELS